MQLQSLRVRTCSAFILLLAILLLLLCLVLTRRAQWAEEQRAGATLQAARAQ